MITYVAVILAVIAMLYLSFRALGGGGTVNAEDYRTVLARIGEFTAVRAAEIDDALRSTEAGPLVEAAGAARKLTGYQEQLGRLEPDAGAADRDVLESSRSLLSVAIEDLGWACRMLEAGHHGDNQGVQRAVADLCAAAAGCITAAQRLLNDPAAAPAGR